MPIGINRGPCTSYIYQVMSKRFNIVCYSLPSEAPQYNGLNSSFSPTSNVTLLIWSSFLRSSCLNLWAGTKVSQLPSIGFPSICHFCAWPCLCRIPYAVAYAHMTVLGQHWARSCVIMWGSILNVTVQYQAGILMKPEPLSAPYYWQWTLIRTNKIVKQNKTRSNQEG